jgi:large repetitive protein
MPAARGAASTVSAVPARPLAAVALVVVGVTLAGCGGGGGGSGVATPSTTQASSASTTSSAGSTTSTTTPGAISVAAASWRLPAPASREVLLADDASLFLLGGLDSAKRSSAAVLRIDPKTGASAPIAQLAPGVHDAGGYRHGSDLLVVGGGAPPAVAAVQAAAFNAPTRSVGQLAAPRADLVVAVVGDTAYALGGADEQSGAPKFRDRVEASSDGGVTWKDAGALAEAVRYPAVAVVGDAIYLFGGVTTSGSQDTRSVQRYDPATRTTTVVGQLPAPLSHASALALGGHVYVLGGFVDNKVSPQVLRFDPVNASIESAGTLPEPVSDGATAVIGTVGYYAGGQGADNAVTDQVTIVRPTP